MKKSIVIHTIKKLFRSVDFFGESFTFRYKDEDKHSTVLGGILCIIFYSFAILYFGLNLKPFLNSEHFSLQYYAMNIDKDKEKKLYDWPMEFAFGFTVDNNNISEISNLLDIKVKYTVKINNKSNDTRKIKTHKCTREDFTKIDNETFINSSIDSYFCINKNDFEDSPQGIFTDDKFSYYVISVVSNSEINETNQIYKTNKAINDYLTENDCKLQFYYVDLAINANNKSHPNSTFLNSVFLQLNPTLIQKKNIFYMDYNLSDDDYWIHFNHNQESLNISTFTGFSRVEDYATYKGLNRSNKEIPDINAYAKIYIRADNKKIEIQRRYQDFMEFYADNSALLLSFFWILGIIFAYYDRIKANHSISKKLFYFEGTKNNLNELQGIKKIKHLIDSDKTLENNIEKINNNPDNFNILHLRVNSNQKMNSNNKIMRNNFVRRDTKTELNVKKEELRPDKNLIDYSEYNIFEMIGSSKLFKCKTKKFKTKVNIFRQAKEMIDNKLDIIFYIRNMFLFELIKKISLENKHIVNFLSRPIIHLNPDKKKSKQDIFDIDTTNADEIIDENGEGTIKEKIQEKPDLELWRYYQGGELYKTAYNLDSTKLSKNIESLMIKPNKTKNDNILIDLLKKHVKDF